MNSRGHLKELVCPVDRVFEMCKDTKLNLPLVSRDVKECAAVDLLVVDFEIRQSSVQTCAPVHKSAGTVDESLLV